MRKTHLLALFTLLLLLAAVPAMAESPYTDEVRLYPPTHTGGSLHIFAFAGADDGWFADRSVDLAFNKGYLYFDCYYRYDSYGRVYPAIEAKIWYWDTNRSLWVMEQNYDIYHEREHTVEFERTNTFYCIQLYYWEPYTVASSYLKNGKFYFPDTFEGPMSDVREVYWGERNTSPYVVATPGEDAVLLRQSPNSKPLPYQQ